jgi:transposase
MARHIAVLHASLRAGDPCPKNGCKGKVYRLAEPAPILRIFGQPPLTAICWNCEQLRCNTCGKVYTARAPEEAQGEKYDETAASMIALLCYGTGMPFNRLDQLQRDLDTPVPASTQWDVVKERVERVRPVYDELGDPRERRDGAPHRRPALPG